MMRFLILLSTMALSSAVLVACSSNSTPQQPYVAPQGDRITEQEQGVCPNPSVLLIGTTAAGDACQQGADCAPTCCACNNGTNRSWLAVHCASKVCASATQTCADTENDGGHCESPP